MSAKGKSVAHILEPQVICGEMEHQGRGRPPKPQEFLPHSGVEGLHMSRDFDDDSKKLDLRFEIASQQQYLSYLESTVNDIPELKAQKEVDIELVRSKIRKLKLRLSQRNRLATENQEQREHRLEKLRNNQRKRLANETPEKRQKRLQAMRTYALQRASKIKSQKEEKTLQPL